MAVSLGSRLRDRGLVRLLVPLLLGSLRDRERVGPAWFPGAGAGCARGLPRRAGRAVVSARPGCGAAVGRGASRGLRRETLPGGVLLLGLPRGRRRAGRPACGRRARTGLRRPRTAARERARA